MTSLMDPITKLKGIGKQRAEDLKKLNIETIEDLLYHFPHRYEDRASLTPIHQLEDQSMATVVGIVGEMQEQITKNGKHILKVRLICDSGWITLVWFHQSFIAKKIYQGMNMIATGKVSVQFGTQLSVQDFEIIPREADMRQYLKIMPIHSGTEKSNPKFIRKLIENSLELYLNNIEEMYPEKIMKQYRLLSLKVALKEIHFPSSWAMLKQARFRLVFDEFFVMLIGLQQGKVVQEPSQGIAHAKTEKLTNTFISKLPFTLTEGQKKVMLELKKDMESSKATKRLVQGDVGCGKTMIAIYGLLKAVEGGYQSAFMAPTEILAEQHYINLTQLLQELPISIGLLKGSMTKKEKDEMCNQISLGTIDVIVGTHALIQKNVKFKQLGMVVIDEQHRFGVKQRLALEYKGEEPDTIMMTATPIPRSLALTQYGDMDISIIDQMPPGRQSIKTYCVGSSKRQDMYGFLKQEIEKGYQVYVVCPLVEQSEKLDLENAVALAEKLQNEIFPQYIIGLLHGKMTTKEKAHIMEGFRTGKFHILVATTVIEVGVDVANANVMVIENAERFGLAQLHQLRGRVGRGQSQATCILIADVKTEESRRRMAIMQQSNNGFVLAEEDLALRGPGEILGTRQHGLPELKIANLVTDISVLEAAKDLCQQLQMGVLEKEAQQQMIDGMQQIYAKKMALLRRDI